MNLADLIYSKNLDSYTKLKTLIQLAKIINTFHSLRVPLVHGDLTPHNIFIDVGQERL